VQVTGMDLSVVAYGTLALSLLVSAVKVGGWVVNADPRAIAGAARWTLAGIPLAALALLAWLAFSGQWTAAMFLAAFLLPVLVQALPRWRILLAPLGDAGHGMPPFAEARGGEMVRYGAPPDSELVERAAAVLDAYLAQARPEPPRPPAPRIAHRPPETSPPRGNGSGKGHAGNGHSGMSTQEAFAVLGLQPTPSPREVKEAHRRLAQRLAPEQGGSPYLLARIDAARDALLGE
jgi:hypothetical protein